MGISIETYQWLDRFSPFLVFWILFFTILTTVRIVMMKRRGEEVIGHNSVLTELAALPLTLLQSACFYKAAKAHDVVSMALFLWWGPGFVFTVLYLIHCKVKKKKPNWYPYRLLISWLCKLNYFAFMLAFYVLGFPSLMFVYSVWVINDQYGMAFLSRDADRLRRTFDDVWLVRILYPLGLFWPFVYPTMSWAALNQVYGVLLFFLWVAGIVSVQRRVGIKTFPARSTLLRNMVYFSKPHDRS
jgi:hypothetical protein